MARLAIWLACCLPWVGGHLPEGGDDDAAAPRAYFVSSSAGSDAAAGAEASPWRTLPHAQAMARAAIQGGGTVSVTLQGGVYRLNETLAFDARDSGSVWQAAPGTAPRITASVSVPLTSFKPVVGDPRIPSSAQGKVVSAKLTDIAPGLDTGTGFSGWTYRDTNRLEVFARGKTLTLARFPNIGDQVPGSPFTGYAAASEGFSAPNISSAATGDLHTPCSCMVRFGLCPPACMPNAKANAVAFADAPGAGGLGSRPAQWAKSGGAPQLAVHGAWRFEWADQMMNVILTNLSNHT